MNGTKLGTRHLHHWRGKDRKEDITELTITIAAAVPRLCDYGGIAQLDGKGGLSPVSLAAFRSLLDQHVCEEVVVNRDGVWRQEYRPFQFAPVPRAPPPTQQAGLPVESRSSGPDDKALLEIYTRELALRLPRVEQ